MRRMTRTRRQRTHHAPKFRHRERMRRRPTPITSIVLAGICWGSSFAVVGLVDGTNPMVLTGSRFALFGLISAGLLVATGGARGVPWRTALLHAAGGSVGLYLAEVTAIGLAGAGPTIAIVGSIPVVYAAVGARRDGTSLRPLLPSFALTGASHVVIHGSTWQTNDRPLATVVLGSIVALLGVAGFCAYALHATDHLRSRPDLSPARWSSAVGVASGFCAVPLLILGGLAGSFGDPSRLAAAAIFLAIGPSWLAIALWNRGIVTVPRSLAGQLLVFEPLSAFVFVHLVAFEFPNTTVLSGELLLLAGALLAVRRVEVVGQTASSNNAISSSNQALGVG
jgi:drug/metabolite transporter (DMT)-like permease